MGTTGKIALGLCLLAAVVDSGLVRPTAFDGAQRDVSAWQRQAAAGLSCRVATHEALGVSGEDALALLERHCGVR